MRAERVGHPKVGDFDVALLVEQQIFRLQIAVRHALLVAVPDAVDQLPKVLPRDVLGEPPLGDDAVEVLLC